MRIASVALLALLVSPASTQIWEKRLGPGLTYRMEVDEAIPRLIHALRWSPGAKTFDVVPALAGGTVYEAGPSDGRKTVSETVKDLKAVAGINADFFPWTGDPLGLMVRDGEILSLPYPGRVSFGWNGPKVSLGFPKATAVVKSGTQSFTLDTFNAAVPENQFGVFTSSAGVASGKGLVSAQRFQITSGSWTSGQTVHGKALGGYTGGPIEAGEFVIMGTGTKVGLAEALSTSQDVQCTVTLSGDFSTATSVVSGGPVLVSKGLVATDSVAEDFPESFYGKRHPRSAIGVTVEGDFWLVVVDGRQGFSAGSTIDELARVMQRLGCMEAINLDGGGSSCLNIDGQVINRPSEGKEREVASILAVMGKLSLDPGGAKLLAPEKVKPKSKTPLKLLDEQGKEIDNRRILWSVTGSGWIDQGGVLRATAEGTCFVSAWCGGKVTSQGIKVAP